MDKGQVSDMKLFGKKLKKTQGFSLAETLVALLIILLVASVVAAGMPAAKDAYFKVIESANAQVFLSTTLTTLRNEMTTAKYKRTVSGQFVFENAANGEFIVSFDSGQWMIQTNYDVDPNASTNPPRPLVSNAVKTDTLNITGTSPTGPSPSIKYDLTNGIVSVDPFNIESTITNTTVAELLQPYSIRILVDS